VRHHALSDAQFAALAAGRPSAAALAELRRAEHSRLLLLLRFNPFGYGLPLHTDEPLPTDPLWAAWAAHTLRTATSAGTHPPAADSPTVLPPLGAAPASDSTSPADSPITASPRPGPTAAAPDSGVSPGMGASTAGHRLTASHHALTINVRLEDADPRRALLGLPPTTARLTAPEVAHWQACLERAWNLLVSRHRPAAEVLATVVRVIVPVLPDPAARGVSATSADAYGAIAMSAPADHVELAVGMLHETQHSLLNAVQHLFDLHTEPRALGYSPWRDDPRPVSGMLHGAYAYLAVTRFWRTEHRADPGNQLAAFEFARWRAAVASTAESLLARDALTPAGRRFVTALHDEVHQWLADPVDPEAARLAAAAGLDHELRWRLRNHQIAPADVTELAAAWRHSHTPAHPVQGGPVPEEGRSHAGRQANAPDGGDQSPRRAIGESRPPDQRGHASVPSGPGSNEAAFPPDQVRPAWEGGRAARQPTTGLGERLGAPAAPRLPTPRLIPGPRRALENSPRLDLIHRALTNPSETAPKETAPSEAVASETTASEAVPSKTTACEATVCEPAPGKAALSKAALSKATRSEATRSEATRSEAAQSNAAQSNAAQSDAARSNAARSEAARGEAAGGGGAGGTGDSAGARATAADDAFLRGDYGTALRAYRREIDLDLDDDTAWSGLAITARDDALTRHLELVAAICRHLGDDHPDPLRLAAWISG
jgi:HEXXH motif-containing protein